jgi:putative ABC transport system substrate-binding protein
MTTHRASRRTFVAGAAAALFPVLLAAPVLGRAQTPRRKFRLAMLQARGGSPTDQGLERWKRALGRQGLAEGVDYELMFAPVWAGGGTERMYASAREVVAQAPDLLITNSTDNTRAAQRATTTIPIVFMNVADPVAAGFVKSLAAPEGNLTGVSVHNLTLFPKRLQLIRELLPGATRVALIIDGAFVRDGFPPRFYSEVRAAAKTAGLHLVEEDIEHLPGGIEEAFGNAARERVDIVLPLGPWPSDRSRVFSFPEAQNRYRVPVLGWIPARGSPHDGLFAQYGVTADESIELGARLVARVLAGNVPRDIPVLQATRVELVVNLAVAREFGIKVPKQVLKRADRVIG